MEANQLATKRWTVIAGALIVQVILGIGPVVVGVLFDGSKQYVLAFVFAGILCFVAAASSIVVWGLARRPVPIAAR